MGARITNLKISGINSIEREIELSFNDNNIKDSLLTERSNVKGFILRMGRVNQRLFMRLIFFKVSL